MRPRDGTGADADGGPRHERLLALLRAHGVTDAEIERLAAAGMDALTLAERIGRLLAERRDKPASAK